MPIIPVLTPEGDYSPPRMAVPDIGDLPMAKQAQLAAGVGELNTAVSGAVAQYQNIQGQIEAQKARVQYAADVETLKKGVLDAPLKPRPNSGAAPEDPASGEGAWQYESLGMQPKSETMVDDFQKGLKDLDAQYEKRLGPSAQRWFRGPQARIAQFGTKAVIDARTQVFDNEQVANLKQTTDVIHKDMGTLPPQQPEIDATSGIPSYDPEKNGSYVVHRNLINDTFNHATSLGMSPKVVESMREREINKLDRDTAEKAMHADPESWALASQSGTNGWEKRLDSTQMDRLESRATAAVTRSNANADKQAKKDKEVAEQDLGVMQAAGDIPLAEIQKRSRVLGKDTAFWMEQRNSLVNGKWDDVPEVKRDLSIKARQFNPAPGMETELNLAFTRHQLSDSTHKELMADVRSSRDRQQKLGIDANVRAMQREHETAHALLYPPPLMASDKGDLAKNYADYLQEYTDRVKQEGEGAAPKIAQELKPKYLGRMGDYLSNYQQLANTALPKPIPIDEKTGAADPADVQSARKDAYARSGFANRESVEGYKRVHNGSLPPALENELYNIDQIVTYGRLRSKTQQDAADVKGKVR